jgi:transcriptional regulator of arginine metabolism
MPKQRRRELLTGILRVGPAPSQEGLVDALARAGERATQATVSRDLAAIGAVRGPGGYMLAEASLVGGGGEDGAVASVLKRHAVSVSQADSLVVIRTSPGHAGVVAVEIDRSPPDGVVGTIAGDDTIFLASNSQGAAARLTNELRDIIERGEGAA